MAKKSLTTDENLERLTGVVATLAASVTEHDRQIDALIRVAEKNQAAISELRATSANLDRRWQAYLSTLRKQ